LQGVDWTSGEPLWNFSFHNVQGISWLVAELLATEGFCSSELVQYVMLHVLGHYTLAHNWYFPLVALRQHTEIRTRSTFQFDRKNFLIRGPQYSKAHRVVTRTETNSGVPKWGGLGGSNPPPKFRSFGKAKPNPQFRGKYIRNCLVFLFHHPN
jgi:hypothetical protein